MNIIFPFLIKSQRITLLDDETYKNKDFSSCVCEGSLKDTKFITCNFRGASFVKANLINVTFENCDIHSANFSDSRLKRVKILSARAGLQYRWQIMHVFIAFITSFVTSSMASFAGFASVFLLVGKINGFSTLVPGLIILLAGSIIFALVISVGIKGLGFGNIAGAGALSIAIGIASGSFTTVLITTLGFFIGAFFVILNILKYANSYVEFIIAFLVSMVFMALSYYIAVDSLENNNSKYQFISDMAIQIASIGGTNFDRADLTDADFTNSDLRNSRFKEAIITGVCWAKVKNISRVFLGNNTYLSSFRIRDLAVNFQDFQNRYNKENDKNFDDLQMQGINLRGADLTLASFARSNLSYSNLENAILAGVNFSESNLDNANCKKAQFQNAILVRTKLNGANLSESILTGSCIEGWGITPTTNRESIECKYVYMLSVSIADKRLADTHSRKPNIDSQEFTSEDFYDFINPITQTLDLYYEGKMDANKFGIAFQKLVQFYPDAGLEIIALERKGETGFVVKAKTTKENDIAGMHEHFIESYNTTDLSIESSLGRNNPIYKFVFNCFYNSPIGIYAPESKSIEIDGASITVSVTTSENDPSNGEYMSSSLIETIETALKNHYGKQ
jgi:uncharacterized protein YjbI with pentapeptide repeats